MIGQLWRNKKKGDVYIVIDDDGVNCTNAQAGQRMVYYRLANGDGKMLA